MNYRERTSLQSRQHGVLAVTTPLLILLIFLFTVLLLDGARLYALKREMQGVANAAATAAAGAAQACGGEFVSQHFIEEAAMAAADSQGIGRLGGQLTSVQPGTLTSDSLGVLSFRPVVNSIYESNAVRVIYEKQEPMSRFLPDLLGSISMRAAAVARQEVIATVSASGSTAVIGGSDRSAGLLGGLLGALLTNGSPFRLDATNVKSLANTTFVLGEFLSALGVGELLHVVDEVVPANELVAAILAGLGEQAGEAGGVLDQILAQSDLINTNIRLGDVLNLVGDASELRQARIPVYDTLVSVALNALSGHVLELEVPINLQVNLGELLTADIQLVVGHPPSVVVGPARFYPDGRPMVEFHAADIVLGLEVAANVLGIASLKIPLMAEVGGGSGYLEYADCASGYNNDVQLGFVLNTSTLTLSTSELNSQGSKVASSISAEVLPALSNLLPVLTVDVRLPGLRSGASQTMAANTVYNLHEKEIHPIEVGSGLAITSLDDYMVVADIKLKTKEEEGCGFLGLGCVLGPILNPVLELVGGLLGLTDILLKDAVFGLVNIVLNDVLKPLLDGLGLKLGGMSVEVTYASQSGVSLVDCSLVNCDGTVLGEE